MALEIIQPGEITWGQVRLLLNRNRSEIEERLANIEVSTYIRSGGGAPEDGRYNNGDYYIDTNNWNLWRKLSGTWALQTNLVGPRGIVHSGAWNNTTTYQKYDGVTYRGSYWYALRSNLGVTPNSVNTDDWERITIGYNFSGDWATATLYEKDDLVLSGGSLWRVVSRHNSTTAPDTNDVRYALFAQRGLQGIPGLEHMGNWSSAATYNFRDGVVYRGSYWLALRTNTNVAPTTGAVDDWLKIARGLNPVGTWVTATTYRIDDIVIRNGSTYRVTTTHVSSTAPPAAGDATYELLAGKGEKGDAGVINRVQNTGINLTQRPNLNFGTGVTAVDNAAADSTDVSVDVKARGAFRAALTTAQSVPSGVASPYTKINFDIANFDVEGSLNTTNGRFVIPAGLGGIWSFGGAVTIGTDAAGRRAILYLRRDAAVYSSLDSKHTGNASVLALVGDDLINCAVGQVIDLAVWHNSAVTEPIILGSASTNFWGYYLGTP